MKKVPIQVKVGLLLIFAVVILSATCYLAYRNLSSIVSSIQFDVNPELRLRRIREISHDLEAADNSVRIYTITRDSSDLKGYSNAIAGIDRKFNLLRQECLTDTIMLNQVDTIGTLVEENIVIWNQLLFLINSDSIVGSLENLAEQINNTPELTEEKGILQRVFSNNKKEGFDEQDVITNILEIEKQGKLAKEELKIGEAQLAETSMRIKEKFYDLITRMEKEVSLKITEKSDAVTILAEKTFSWLLLFSVSGGILALLVLFIIIRYIRNARIYQVALEKSKNEAENLAKSKELFMANVSHEIRTPVTAISGFTEQLLKETTDRNAMESLKIVKSSSDHLARIIDDILDLSKLQNGKLALEQIHFNLETVTGDVYNIFEWQAKQKGIQFIISITALTPKVLLGDPYRLKQILINLVGNAIKFTDNGSVVVMIEAIKKQPDRIVLQVEVGDTGIGIDADKLDFIFEDFAQAEMSTTRKYGGTGLGLSIVKNLVKLYGGTILCESKRNEGTRIKCDIPFLTGLSEKVKKVTLAPLTIPEEIKKLRILVVDDEQYNRLLFKKIFSKWNVFCEESADGLEAIEKLKTQRFDLVFMDVRMPGIDGLKAACIIRDELKITHEVMQIICISAQSVGDEGINYKQAGMNALMHKPFTEEMLLATIINVRELNTDNTGDFKQERDEIKQTSLNKINLDNLNHISGGDIQFVKQMLIAFLDTTRKGIDELQESARQGKLDSVAGIAHKLQPPCKHLGAFELYGILKSIEKESSEKSGITELNKSISNFVNEFDSIKKEINNYLDTL